MRGNWVGDSHSLTKRSLQDGIRSALFAGIVVFSVWSFVLLLHWVTLKRPATVPPQGWEHGFSFPVPDLENASAAKLAAIPGVENDPEIDSQRLLELASFAGQLQSRFLRGLAEYEAKLPTGKGYTVPRIRLGPWNSVEGSSPLTRWMIVYDAEDESQYLDQLQAFGIEIGAVHRAQDQIELISCQDPQQVRTISRNAERRVYFVSTESDVQRIDRRTVKRAGVKLDDKFLVQFIPDHICQSLMLLERGSADERGLELSQIRRTVFKIRANGPEFEFYVAEMIPVAK